MYFFNSIKWVWQLKHIKLWVYSTFSIVVSMCRWLCLCMSNISFFKSMAGYSTIKSGNVNATKYICISKYSCLQMVVLEFIFFLSLYYHHWNIFISNLIIKLSQQIFNRIPPYYQTKHNCLLIICFAYFVNNLLFLYLSIVCPKSGQSRSGFYFKIIIHKFSMLCTNFIIHVFVLLKRMIFRIQIPNWLFSFSISSFHNSLLWFPQHFCMMKYSQTQEIKIF